MVGKRVGHTSRAAGTATTARAADLPALARAALATAARASQSADSIRVIHVNNTIWSSSVDGANRCDVDSIASTSFTIISCLVVERMDVLGASSSIAASFSATAALAAIPTTSALTTTVTAVTSSLPSAKSISPPVVRIQSRRNRRFRRRGFGGREREFSEQLWRFSKRRYRRRVDPDRHRERVERYSVY